jgi:hypothetical protein
MPQSTYTRGVLRKNNGVLEAFGHFVCTISREYISWRLTGKRMAWRLTSGEVSLDLQYYLSVEWGAKYFPQTALIIALSTAIKVKTVKNS